MNPTPIIINPDGLTAKAKNPYKIPLPYVQGNSMLDEINAQSYSDNIDEYTRLCIEWRANNPSYPLTEPGEPGAEVKAVLIERKTIFDYKEGDEIWFIHFGERIKCRVIGYSEGANKVRFGYMPGCGTGSFYESLDSIEANNPTTFWQVVSNKEETAAPNSKPEETVAPIDILQKALDYLHNNISASIVYEDFYDFSKGIKGAEVDYFPENSDELLAEMGYSALAPPQAVTEQSIDYAAICQKELDKFNSDYKDVFKERNLSIEELTNVYFRQAFVITTNHILSSKGLVERETVERIIKEQIKNLQEFEGANKYNATKRVYKFAIKALTDLITKIKEIK